MKNKLTLALLLSTASLFGQNDLFSALVAASEKHELLHGIRQITERVYAPYSIDDESESEPDTTLTLDGEPVALYLQQYQVIAFKSPTEITTTSFERGGERTMRVVNIHHPDGRLLSETIDLGDGPAGQIMNNTKTYTYDESGRITEISSINPTTGNEQTAFTVRYRPDGLPAAIYADAGIGTLNVQVSEHADTIRYTLNMEFSPEMQQMMASMLKKQPVEYTDVVYDNSCACYQYTTKKQDPETGAVAIESIITRNKNGQVLREELFAEGEPYAHATYTYDGARLLSKTNLLDETTQQNEYDANGKLTVEYADYVKMLHRYDKRGNRIQTVERIADSGDIQSVTLREIVYE